MLNLIVTKRLRQIFVVFEVEMNAPFIIRVLAPTKLSWNCVVFIFKFLFFIVPPPQRTISNKSGFRPPSCNCYLVKAFLFNLKILNARPFLDNQTKKYLLF